VHDTVDFLDLTDGHNSLADLLRFQRTRLCLHRARRILSVSQATRRDLQRLFGLPGEKIEVVYNAPDARLVQPPSTEEVERTLHRYSIHAPYLLYAGNVKPHKNLPRLIEAFALVKDGLRAHPQYAEMKLIIIGDELFKHPQLRRAVVKSRTQDDVRFLGFVPPQTLSVFYACATAFVFPSLYEGFGLPPLEAMALGTPVVASNVSALPEVLRKRSSTSAGASGRCCSTTICAESWPSAAASRSGVFPGGSPCAACFKFMKKWPPDR
jgi:glycosyltransferase involved in cell wall biosynthesis